MSIENKPNAESPNAGSQKGQLFVAAIDRVFDELASSAESSDSNLVFNTMADRLVELFPDCSFVVWAGLEEEKTVVINRSGVNFIAANNSYRYDDSNASGTQSLKEAVANELAIGFCWSADDSSADREQLRLKTEVLKESANIAREHFRGAAIVAGTTNELSEQLFEFSNRCHHSLELKSVARHVVTGGEKLLGADRVWLFAQRGRNVNKPELLACSSVADVDSRSEDLSLVSDVAQEAFRLRKSTFASYDDLNSLGADRSSTANYLNRFKSKGLYVCLVRGDDDSATDVLIVECFEPHDRLQLVAKLSKIPVTVRPALANAREHEAIPFRNLLKRISGGKKLNGSWWKRIAALATLIGFVAMFFVPIDFTIPVEGTLKPVVERQVFAPADGTVTGILVDYGDQVSAGEKLLVLHSADYQLKLKQTQGELLSANKELESVQLLRSQASESGDELETNQLTSRIEQVGLKIRSLNEKNEFYLKQVATLTLNAPITGKVTTEDLRQMLMNRPVGAGDPLVSIAEIDGDWHAELEINSVDLSYLDQQREAGHSIRFRSLASIQQEHEGHITEIEGFNSIDEDGNVTVAAFVPIDKKDFEHLRVGTPITGTIHCGRRSIAFVWTREIRDFLRTNFFWF